MTSIASSLGVGSGLDTTSIVEKLTAAVKEPKEAAIKKRETTNTAKISSLASAVSGIDTFSTSLTALISGGTLFTQPNSSDTSIVSASAIAGARIGNLSATLEIKQLAQAQTVVSGNLGGNTATVGAGTLTLTTANGTFDITTSETDTLDDLAKKISGAGAGLAASVVQDSKGARLVVKSATGAAKAFTVTTDAAADGLGRFTYDAAATSNPTSLAQKPQDATIVYDGVEVTRATNSISDLVPGVKLDLKKAAEGTTVTLGTTRPTTAITNAVTDFVDTYNALKSILDEATASRAADGSGGGPLRGDYGIRDMQRQLSKLTSTVLGGSGTGPKTLAEIGVSTNRDGSLALDTAKLNSMLASDPDGVEALFNPTQTSSSPLLKIGSVVGRTAPGSYKIENVTTSPLAGTIAGFPALVSGTSLIASASSPAAGLVLNVSGDVASATITIDAGIGGALKAIRDSLRGTDGALATAQAAAKKETTPIPDAGLKREEGVPAYSNRLSTSFGTMDTRVAAYKATQSYLDQQIKLWTNDS
ncbi:flagellar filament capping protein FliD [Sphingomonas solaris]|uniref:Flagellar hook-associated protein 2 n=1 Tax=Alterirhizorhabdus solaris TaxID=2529389 RepID=A0A558R1C9_9SPHN|nr:flagellar filament capping protein FliD [Sphingomonas solaris]TVV73180.1 flagellar hook protein [Sphingomonas solaris]